MAIDEATLAERLRLARLASGMSQEQVGEQVGLPRSAVAQIELGRRSVGSIELSRLAAAYGRDLSDFLADRFDAEGALIALFRASGEPLRDPATGQALRRYARLARQLTSLEKMLHVGRSASGAVFYSLQQPRSKAEAARQGAQIAEGERRRLGLGLAPIADLADLLASEGVRTALVALPDAVSGLTISDSDTGPMIIVNSAQQRRRRRFSLAHEYCHALLDCKRKAQISRSDAHDLVEQRANAFAANMLMPADGVERFLDKLGKGGVRREGARGVQLNDVILLAEHFDVSRSMALHRLLALRIVSQRAFEELRADDELRGGKVARLLGVAPAEHDDGEDQFHQRLSNLALDAFIAGEITRAKLDEIYEDALGRSVEDDELPAEPA